MLTLGTKREPQRIVLRAPTGDEPEAYIVMAPISAAMRRRAQRAARKLLGGVTDIDAMDQDRLMDVIEVAARELVRLGAVEWGGIGDGDGKPVALTPDRETRFATSNDPERPVGTIDQLLDDDDYFGIIDAHYVRPDALRIAEKNGLSALPNGTGEAATRGSGTANSAAKPKRAAGAKNVRTAKARCAPKRPKGSGTS